MADGRYLARDGAGEQEQESVLVIETLAGRPAAARRRRRSRDAGQDQASPELPLARATAVRAGSPFEQADAASRWLRSLLESEQAIDAAVDEGLALLNRALHVQAVAAADPRQREIAAEEALAVRLGYGSGEEVARGRFTVAELVDVRGGSSRRAQRTEELRPQERVAAVLGGKERIDACETLLLRVRADLDGGRRREAALQLPAALEALLAELDGAVADPGHDEDMEALRRRRPEAAVTAKAALGGEPSADQLTAVAELLATGERVLRRRRVLRGG